MTWTSDRARHNALKRYRPADDPAVVAAAAALRAARAEDHIRKLVAAWPPLDDDTRARLAAIVAPAAA